LRTKTTEFSLLLIYALELLSFDSGEL
jgi:hypothetical protein